NVCSGMCVLRFLHQWGPGHSPSHEGCHTTRARYRDRRCACPSCKDLVRNRVNLVRADRYLVDVYTDQQLLAQVVSGNEGELRELYGVGEETTVVLSTHILDGVARLCDRVAVLRTGTFTEPLGELAATSPHRVRGSLGRCRKDHPHKTIGGVRAALLTCPVGHLRTAGGVGQEGLDLLTQVIGVDLVQQGRGRPPFLEVAGVVTLL